MAIRIRLTHEHPEVETGIETDKFIAAWEQSLRDSEVIDVASPTGERIVLNPHQIISAQEI